MTATPHPVVSTTQLDNGVVVVTAAMPHHARCHVCVQLRGGPVHESDKTWGLSHLVEHMVFRGTPKHKDSHAVALAADDFGGDIGAATWRDRVVYDTRVDADRVKDALALLALMLGEPRMEGLGIEQGIIESELADLYDDDGNEIDVENAVFRQVFAGHPLSRTIEGTPKKVRSYDKGAVKKFHAACYGAQNLVVAVAGPVVHAAVVKAAAAAFGALPRGEPTPLGEAPHTQKAQTEPLVVVRTEDGQTDVRVCFACPGMHSEDAAALAVIGRLLDDGPASRIQHEIIDTRGLAYAVWAMTDLYEDRGILELGAELQHDKIGVVVDALVQQVEALLAGPPSEAELSRVKQRYARDLRDLADEPSGLAEAIGKGALFRQPFDAAAHIARVNAVDGAAVFDVARRVFVRPQVVLVGLPKKKDIGVVKAAVGRLM
jgi:predicted Zn-dependent peptidase